MAEEIERRFLVLEAADLDQHDSTRIEQGYLAIRSGDEAEVRIRRVDQTFTLTVKGGHGEVRTEEEIEIDADRFESLWSLTADRRVAKTRYRVPHGEFRLVRNRGHRGRPLRQREPRDARAAGARVARFAVPASGTVEPWPSSTPGSLTASSAG